MKFQQNFKKFLDKLNTVENTNTFFSFFITFSFLFLALISVEGVFVSFVPGDDSLYPLQKFETDVVYKIQKGFGIQVEVINQTTLYYKDVIIEEKDGISQGLNLIIIASCTGLHEMIFLSTLILAFRGVSLKTKLKWIGIFLPFLFIENLIRIASAQPLIVLFGFQAWESFHWYFWQYGQLIIVMFLFFFWFLFIGAKELREKEKIPKIDLSEKEKKNFSIFIFSIGVLMFLWAYVLSELMKIQIFEWHLITLFVIIGYYLFKELIL